MRMIQSFLLMIALGTSALVASGCESAEEAREEARQAHHDRLVGYANTAAAEMVYVRDERTGLCYAFWWQRYDRSARPPSPTCRAKRWLAVSRTPADPRSSPGSTDASHLKTPSQCCGAFF